MTNISNPLFQFFAEAERQGGELKVYDHEPAHIGAFASQEARLVRLRAQINTARVRERKFNLKHLPPGDPMRGISQWDGWAIALRKDKDGRPFLLFALGASTANVQMTTIDGKVINPEKPIESISIDKINANLKPEDLL